MLSRAATLWLLTGALIVLLVVGWLVGRKLRNETGEPFVNQPPELEKKTYEAHLIEPCMILDDPSHYATASFLETGRLRKYKGDGGAACYFLNDEKNGAQDAFMTANGGVCDKAGNAMFAGRGALIKRVYESKERDAGEVVPLQKCVVEFDKDELRKPGAVSGLWDAWGGADVTCASVVAPVRAANKRLRGLVDDGVRERDALMGKRDGLLSDKAACATGLGGCTGRWTALKSEVAGLERDFRGCMASYDALKADYAGYYDAFKSDEQRLKVAEEACDVRRGRAAGSLAMCEEDLDGVRRDVAWLRGEIGTLDGQRSACMRDYEMCGRGSVGKVKQYVMLDGGVKGLRGRVATCDSELGQVRAAYQDHKDKISTPCSLMLSEKRREMEELRAALDDCSGALRSVTTDNVTLRTKLKGLKDLLAVLDPENAALKSALGDCRRTVATLREQLEACMKKLGGISDLQDKHLAQLTNMNSTLLGKQRDVVGAYCSRPVIAPPDVSEADKQQLLGQIDDCRVQLERALNERDDFRSRYMALVPRYQQLQVEYALAENKRDWHRDMFHNKDAVEARHNLCEVCATEGVPWTMEEFQANYVFYFISGGEVKTQQDRDNPSVGDKIKTGLTAAAMTIMPVARIAGAAAGAATGVGMAAGQGMLGGGGFDTASNNLVTDEDGNPLDGGNLKNFLFGGGVGRVQPKPIDAGQIALKMQQVAAEATGDMNWVGCIPSYDKLEGCVYFKSPQFKLKQPVTATISVKFENDFYFWVNGQPIWGGSFDAVESNGKTKTMAVMFAADTVYRFQIMFYAMEHDGYAFVTEGLTQLAQALDDGDCVKVDGPDPDDAIIEAAKNAENDRIKKKIEEEQRKQHEKEEAERKAREDREASERQRMLAQNGVVADAGQAEGVMNAINLVQSAKLDNTVQVDPLSRFIASWYVR